MRRPAPISHHIFALVTVAFLVYGTSPVAAQIVLVDFLNFPWGIAELPDGSIMVAESGGEGKISRHYADGTSEDFATDLFDVRDVVLTEPMAGLQYVLGAQTLEDRLAKLSLTGEVMASIEAPSPTSFSRGAAPNEVIVGSFGGALATFDPNTNTLEILGTLDDPIEGLTYLNPNLREGARGGGSILAVQPFAGQITEVFLDGTSEVFATVEGVLNGGIAALDDGSVLVTVDGGASFDPGRVVRIYPDGTQEDFATDLNFPRGLLVRSDGHVLVTNYNSGPLGALLDLGVVPVDSESEVTPVAGLTVSAPSPNPTGDLLRVQVETSTPSRVCVEVYDILGRRVASSFDGVVAEAVNVGIDASGLAPGLYVLRVTGAQATETRRFTVVR